ncbi:MAG TPA: UDP-N-acetylmuramoyl-L-alanine--D-glutamate ligase [Mycobacteriales bacterium]|nr:UDP-N-acetylmuramoyl-L-alanine--D-glutamate ligase [Mycobacteriales bacterium]
MTDFAGRRVAVAGIGISGVAAAVALLRNGADVVVVDAAEGERVESEADRLRGLGATVRLGDATTAVDADLVVTSPGWRPDQPLLAAALGAGVEVIGEPELAWRLRPEGSPDWLGVTGTNGKTTTVGMLASILSAGGLRTVAAGNVGLPLVDAVLEHPPYDVLAVELSSFQLHWSSTLTCAAAAVLNIADDHTDWHGSFDAYSADKAKILRGDPLAVVNLDDAGSVAVSAACTHRIGFTLDDPQPGVLGVRSSELIDADGSVLAAQEDIQLSGRHNIANALAAAALARARGVAPAAVRAGLRDYAPDHHRNELVAVGGGVRWIDDSKATNPHAAAASLAGYDSVVWIAGGLLKGARVDELVAGVAGRLRAAVVLGQDRATIAQALKRHAPDVPVVTIDTADTDGMNEAVRAADRLAEPGDAVVLAPAAASMDMFRNYAERGDRFAAAARDAARNR